MSSVELAAIAAAAVADGFAVSRIAQGVVSLPDTVVIVSVAYRQTVAGIVRDRRRNALGVIPRPSGRQA